MNSIDTLKPILQNQIPVVTTELLAQLYGADVSSTKIFNRALSAQPDAKNPNRKSSPQNPLLLTFC